MINTASVVKRVRYQQIVHNIMLTAAAMLIMCMVYMLLAASVHAETKALDPDVSTPSDGCRFLGVEGTYITEAEAALQRINEIRYEACTEGDVPDPRNTSRMLTESDYVPIKWSADLERIARIRAAESSLTMAHKRLNGKSLWTTSYNGLTSVAEDIAWNYGSTMTKAIEQWYAEKGDWVEQNSDAVTGHYTSMINPYYTYVGLGTFYSSAGKYRNTTAGEFTGKTTDLTQDMLAGEENIIQKLEVQDSYIGDYVLSAPKSIYKDETGSVSLMQQITYDSSSYNLISLEDCTFRSSDESIATVSSEGTVNPKATGFVTITASISGTDVAEAEIAVNCRHQFTYADVDENSQRVLTCTICGHEETITVPSKVDVYWRNSETTSGSYYYYIKPDSNPSGSRIIFLFDGNEGTSGYTGITVSSSDESVLKPSSGVSSSSGYFDVLKAGYAKVTFTAEYNPAVSKSYEFIVGSEGEISIEDADITISSENFKETGKAIEPSVNVSYQGYKLTSGTDYSATYSDNIAAGTGKITITGSGIFAGTKTKEFAIKHELSAVDAKASTCQKNGHKAYWYCEVCDKYFSDGQGLNETTIDKLKLPLEDHVFKNYVNDNNAACTEDATKTAVCEYGCGAKDTVTVPDTALGHKWETEYTIDKKPSCTEAGSRSIHCSRCDESKDSEEIEALGHSWDEGKITKKPTCTEKGVMTFTCTRSGCKETRTEDLEAKGHNYKHKTVAAKVGIEGAEYDQCTECGDIINKTTTAALSPDATSITKLKKGKKCFNVKWKKKAYTGYQVQYSLNSTMESAKTVTITKAKTVSKKVKKLKKKKTYYVRVRTYKTVSGTKYYSYWSAVKSVKTK